MMLIRGNINIVHVASVSWLLRFSHSPCDKTLWWTVDVLYGDITFQNKIKKILQTQVVL